MNGAESFEYLMGLHAAPMLAGPKPASLVSFRKSRFEDFDGRASHVGRSEGSV